MSFLGYWPIEEFARSVLGGSSKHKAVAVIVGYFDESGISYRDHITLCGGAIAGSIDWTRIERPWRKWLAAGQFSERAISCFHAVDCEHGEGEFSSIDRPFRDALAWKLSDEIGKMRPQCISSGVVREDWPYASQELRDAVNDDPYYFSVMLCLEQVASWSRRFAGGEPVALVFAKQSTLNAFASVIHSAYHDTFPEIGSMTFGEPKLIIPLQVADFVAYESYRFYADRIADQQAKRRRLWENLEKRDVSMDFKIHNRDTLPKIKPRND